VLFNSIEFLIFLPVVVGLHFLLPHRLRWVLLLTASYAFYMSWNAAYLGLIVVVTAVAWGTGLRIAASDDPRVRKRWLVISVSVSLGILFAFKYWNFANEQGRAVTEALGTSWPVPDLDVLLPIGISFYTFQALSYTVDLYRGLLPEAERHPGRFALYVAFFPQLVAGPIERATRLLPQMDLPKSFDLARCVAGLELILWGLFKKVVIADRLAIYVNAVYGNPAGHDGATFWVATYAFAFQIFCDFSAYSDIAVGAARMLGFELMENFRTPYFATSITEFWRRWHISLSTWLRDYLYISLGGNRGSVVSTYRNLLITMLLGGLWHGASWNFVIWGAWHGGLLSLSRASMSWRDSLYEWLRCPAWLRDAARRVITFHLVCLGWVFFRAPDFDASSAMITEMVTEPLGHVFVDLSTFTQAGFGVLVLLAAQTVFAHTGEDRSVLQRQRKWVRFALAYALIGAIVLLGVDGGGAFIYFQF